MLHKSAIQMIQTDEIIYQAILADDDLLDRIDRRVQSTCFEVSPTEQDNTPLPYLIVIDAGFTCRPTTKDMTWEGSEEQVVTSVVIAADSPAEVKRLMRMVRRAVSRYAEQQQLSGMGIYLAEAQGSGVEWDWTKPCYFTTLTYQLQAPAPNWDDEEL